MLGRRIGRKRFSGPRKRTTRINRGKGFRKSEGHEGSIQMAKKGK